MFNVAKLSDRIHLMGMAKAFHKFSGYEELVPWDESAIMDLMAHCISNGFILFNDDSFIVILYQPHPFNSRVHSASELAMWVNPNNRGSGLGENLLKAAMSKCKVDGRHHLCMASIEMYPEVSKMYEANGFVKKESAFVRTL